MKRLQENPFPRTLDSVASCGPSRHKPTCFTANGPEYSFLPLGQLIQPGLRRAFARRRCCSVHIPRDSRSFHRPAWTVPWQGMASALNTATKTAFCRNTSLGLVILTQQEGHIQDFKLFRTHLCAMPQLPVLPSDPFLDSAQKRRSRQLATVIVMSV